MSSITGQSIYPIGIFTDNLAALALSKNPLANQRTKHIDVNCIRVSHYSSFSISILLLTVRIPQPYLGLLLLVSPPLFSLLAHTISSAHKGLLLLVSPPLFSLLAHTISSAHKGLLLLVSPPLFSLLAHTISSAHKA
ncbi:hypothetical protein PCASD_01515 [Puccinia coronata f. sp. avenae]|uniref:Uncharacterized protein n=1 Tax=Puccinia coronata f. sp. avenae TaxID=200324 RepID=A0A2N5VIG4_9BASI|nr:hypothetical protein PCASD_01515 [Puccinia coronata f. sp. avenae]